MSAFTAGLGHNGGPAFIEYAPQPGPQAALLACPIEDIFFGGARGGGKTFGMLLDWLHHAQTYGQFATGVFFRKIAKNLEEVIQEAHRIFPRFGGKWQKSTSTYVFTRGPARGARLKFRHLANEADADAYQGHAYTWICFEEVTQFATPGPVDMLRATLRSAHGVPCVFRATGNPGGAGHNWVKARYVSPAPLGFKVITDPSTGDRRVFIPSRLEDNRILTSSDPRYENRLRASGNASLVKAWRFGDWDIVAGGFFDDIWSPEKHVIAAFDMPASWTRRRSFDWGSSKPASLGMYAISDGVQPRDHPRHFPRGSVIRFGEWYTVAHGPDGLPKPDVGLKLENRALGRGIAERSRNINWQGCVADPSIFTKAGGPSLYDQLLEGAKEARLGLTFRDADNSRVAGWARFRELLKAAAEDSREAPGFYVTANCTEFIRTFPVLQMDKSRPDDVDSASEDHAADEARYLIMSAQSTGGGFSALPLRGR